MRVLEPGANADCLECSGSEERQMQLNADADLLHESNRQRMRAVALLSESIAAQMEPGGRSAALGNAERYGVGCSSRLTA